MNVSEITLRLFLFFPLAHCPNFCSFRLVQSCDVLEYASVWTINITGYFIFVPHSFLLIYLRCLEHWFITLSGWMCSVQSQLSHYVTCGHIFDF